MIVRLASVGSLERDGIRFGRPDGGQDLPL